MSNRKWGESFLKSGLPLEYLTVITLKDLGYMCSHGIEYVRVNTLGDTAWFELDIDATYRQRNKDTYLSLLIECKYHDESRFWFFLPCVSDAWQFNERVFNCGPFQTLTYPTSRSVLNLASLSYRGIVVSKDGTKQENAVHKAVEQLSNAFVPQTLSRLFDITLGGSEGAVPICSTLVPIIVTNAEIYRLKEDVSDLKTIRAASSPEDVGDKLSWTWYYHTPSRQNMLQNQKDIAEHLKRYSSRFDLYPRARTRLELWASRPNWIAVINIAHLHTGLQDITKHFLSLRTCTSETAMSKNRKVRAK